MSFFSKKKSKKMTRLFFATDIHGSERTYRKFINAGKFYDVNVIVMGGDIQGKLMIPIIKETNGHYRATLQGTVQKIASDTELKQLQDRIGLLGFYSQIMEEDEYKSLANHPDEVDKLFHHLAKERLASWVELAETRLKGTGIKCFVTGGNDDDPEVLEAIKEGGECFIPCEARSSRSTMTIPWQALASAIPRHGIHRAKSQTRNWVRSLKTCVLRCKTSNTAFLTSTFLR